MRNHEEARDNGALVVCFVPARVEHKLVAQLRGRSATEVRFPKRRESSQGDCQGLLSGGGGRVQAETVKASNAEVSGRASWSLRSPVHRCVEWHYGGKKPVQQAIDVETPQPGREFRKAANHWRSQAENGVS